MTRAAPAWRAVTGLGLGTGLRLSLRGRALVTATACLVAILFVDAWARQRVMGMDGRAALTERAGLLASLEAAALSVPLWNLDQDQLDVALDALAADPDFAAASLLRPDGTTLGERRHDAGRASGRIDVARDISFIDHGHARTLGTLRISLSTTRLQATLMADLRIQCLALITLLGAVMMAVLSALHQLTRPLDLLTSALERLAQGDLETPLPWLDRADEVGAVARALAVFRDTAHRLVRAEGQYKAVFDNAALGIFSVGEQGSITGVNAALLAMTGYADRETAMAALHAGALFVRPERRDELAAMVRAQGGYTGEISELRRPDGSTYWVSKNLRSVRNESGAVLGYVGTLEDITDRLRRQSEERLRVRAALQSASDAILIADEQGEPLFANPAFSKAFGYSGDELGLVGGLPALTTDGPTGHALLGALRSASPWQGEADILVRDGAPLPMLIRASPIRDEAGGTVGSVVICTDLTQHRATEARIRHMAHHDALTGLPNRVLFGERLNAALEAVQTDAAGFALLCLDLDRFKDVNDTLGHAVGDRLLRAVAGRLTACLGADDLVARFGGDEFVVLQSIPPGGETAGELAERLIADISRPYVVDAHHVSVGVSVGITLAPLHAAEPGRLLRFGDMALYDAKARGRGQARLFTQEMDIALRQRSDLEQDLRQAVAAEALHLSYQPQYALADGALVGAEALLRWHDPARGHVSPAEFIPIAEDCGLITVLGAWALRAACREAADWAQPLSIAVNLSPVQFRTTDLVGLVGGVLAETGLDPARLELEITEGVLLGDSPDTVAMLAGLKALGVRIAMDDFGTGYSSLSYLRRMPIDKLKIDQSFTRALGTDPAARPLVRSIIGIARDLGIASLAEGVETEAHAQMLREEGCVAVQGYLFGRPMTGEAFAGLFGGKGLARVA